MWHSGTMGMSVESDGDTAVALGLTGTTNLLTVTPAAGTTPEAVRRALLAVPHVGATLSMPTVVEALVLGVLTVAAAPLMTLRRICRLDIPSTLRVME
jgi:putative ABC transport system permease protein